MGDFLFTIIIITFSCYLAYLFWTKIILNPSAKNKTCSTSLHTTSQNVYFRFKPGGEEYGPRYLPELLARHGQKSNLECRFENKKEWLTGTQILEATTSIKATKDQVQTIVALGIPFIKSNLNYKSANDLIQNKKKELDAQRAQKKKKSDDEKAEKGALPVTKQTMKKLDVLGLPYTENTTRAEAQAIIKKNKEDQERKQALAVALTDFNKAGIDITEAFGIKDTGHISTTEAESLIDLFYEKEDIEKKLNQLLDIGVDLTGKFKIQDVLNKTKNDSPFDEYLDNLHFLLKPLPNHSDIFTLPDRLDINSIDALNRKIEDAIDEAEDAEDQVKDRCLYIDDYEYNISGTLPQNNLDKFKDEVIKQSFNGKWNFEREIRKTIKKHFSDVKIKKQSDY